MATARLKCRSMLNHHLEKNESLSAILLKGSRDLVTTYKWAYNPTYNPHHYDKSSRLRLRDSDEAGLGSEVRGFACRDWSVWFRV